jgi:hypothetical protein
MSPCGDYEPDTPLRYCLHWGCENCVFGWSMHYCHEHIWDWDFGHCLKCCQWLGYEPQDMRCPKRGREISGTCPRTHRDRTSSECDRPGWEVPFYERCLLCRDNRDRPKARCGLTQHDHGEYALLRQSPKRTRRR